METRLSPTASSSCHRPLLVVPLEELDVCGCASARTGVGSQVHHRARVTTLSAPATHTICIAPERCFVRGHSFRSEYTFVFQVSCAASSGGTSGGSASRTPRMRFEPTGQI